MPTIEEAEAEKIIWAQESEASLSNTERFYLKTNQKTRTTNTDIAKISFTIFPK